MWKRHTAVHGFRCEADCNLSEGKVGDRKQQDVTAKRLQNCLDNAVKTRAMRLGRGNLLVQRGRFATPAEWQARRDGHLDRLQRIDRWLDEHAEPSSS